MKRTGVILVLACICLCTLFVVAKADENRRKFLAARLVGTCRMVSMKVSDEERNLPKTAVTYKHVTPGGFMRVSHQKANAQ